MSQPIDYSRTLFLQSAPTLSQCPPDEGVEVAFAGRSNAGKSSALNALTHQKKLARISKTPGRTQLINFFDLGDNRRLVDLPGYGYAKVPADVKRAWDRNLADYLQRRASLRGLVLLMDIRHPLQAYDWQMIHWTLEADLALHVLLTKADKLKQGPAKATLLQVQRTLESEQLGGFSLQTFSAERNSGREALEDFLDQYLVRAP